MVFNYLKFANWVSDTIKKRNKVAVKPGMIVSFAYAPQKDDNETDFMPLYILVEAKFQYLYGVNLLRLPKRFQEQLLPLLSIDLNENLRIAAEIHKNPIHRKSYKYYRMENIQSQVVEIKPDDFNRFH